MTKVVLLLSLFLTTYASYASEILKFDNINCSTLNKLTTCKVYFNGIVNEKDAVLITNLSDIDTTKFNDILIGRTGFFFNTIFYSLFIPRVYSLEKIIGTRNPALTINTETVFGDTDGASYEHINIKVISISDAPYIFISLIFWRLFAFLVLGSLAVYAFGYIKESGERSYSKIIRLLFYVSSILFCLSMLKLLRITIPAIFTPLQYYRFHAVVEAVTIFSLAELIFVFMINFKKNINLFDYKTNLNSHATTFLKFVSRTSFIFALYYIFIGFDLNEFGNFKINHSISVLIQSFSLFFVLVGLLLINRAYLRGIDHFLNSEKLICASKLLAVLILIRDSLTYYLIHDSATQYYAQYAFAFVLFSGGYKVKEKAKCVADAFEFSRVTKLELEKEQDSTNQLNKICELIKNKFNFEKVSIVAIKKNKGLMLASLSGNRYFSDSNSKKLGPLLTLLLEKKKMIYTQNSKKMQDFFPGMSLNHPTLVIPILQNGHVAAAIVSMASEKSKISPYISMMIENSANTLSLEVIGAMNLLVSEQKISQLKAIASTTSGIIFENTDDWGRLKDCDQKIEKAIVVADGVSTTLLSEATRSSDDLWNIYALYKKELYAIWFSLLRAFEFISKDVRGDDFWALSPKEFKNPYLKNIGAHGCAVVLGLLLEEHARVISKKSPYDLLGLPGAHVAVGAGLIKVISLGIESARCVDIDSPYLSRLHRIRTEANPGSILVDISDLRLKSFLCNLTSLGANFSLNQKKFYLNKEYAFQSLTDLPDVMMIYNMVRSIEVLKIEEDALSIAKESFFKNNNAA